MSRVKKVFSVPQVPPADTKNREGYDAYGRGIYEQFVQTLFCNSLGNTFYADSKTMLKEATKVHQDMLKEDKFFFADALPVARQEGFMRLQPIYALALLSSADPALFEKTFPGVVQIPSDLQDFMTILNNLGRGQGGRAVKRTVANWMNDKMSEYWVIKYDGNARGYSLGDLVQTIHPKPKNSFVSGLYGYLIGSDKIDLSEYKQLSAYQALKKATDPKEQVRLVREGRLPHEVVTGVTKMNPELWDALVQDMPIFATLRNLNALDRAGVLDKNRKIIEDRLTNPDILAKSKILPFRFLNAFNTVTKPWVKDALRMAVELAFNNLPSIDGRTAVFLDISGSMDGQELQIGSVFALALYKKTGGNGLFWLFNTRVRDGNPSLHDSILTQASKIHSSGGTDTGAPIRKLRLDKEVVDNIIMITDEQQNSGNSFFAELLQYRRSINPRVKTFIIDISGYRQAMVPKDDPNTFYIYGWSDQILSYISKASKGFGTIVDAIKAKRK